jgi:hypothetical protein
MDTNRTPVVRPVYFTIAEPFRSMDVPIFLNMYCMKRVVKQQLDLTAEVRPLFRGGHHCSTFLPQQIIQKYLYQPFSETLTILLVWSSGMTSLSHREDPGFDPQHEHSFWALSRHSKLLSYPRIVEEYKERRGAFLWDSGVSFCVKVNDLSYNQCVDESQTRLPTRLHLLLQYNR